MFNPAIDSNPGGCDVGAPRVDDVAPHVLAVDRAIVGPKESVGPVRFGLPKQTRLPWMMQRSPATFCLKADAGGIGACARANMFGYSWYVTETSA
jgi:hypothetical protein